MVELISRIIPSVVASGVRGLMTIRVHAADAMIILNIGSGSILS